MNLLLDLDNPPGLFKTITPCLAANIPKSRTILLAHALSGGSREGSFLNNKISKS